MDMMEIRRRARQQQKGCQGKKYQGNFRERWD